ncbi:MAG: hypothetical protein AAAB11_00280, partial [Rhizobium giardinii]
MAFPDECPNEISHDNVSKMPVAGSCCLAPPGIVTDWKKRANELFDYSGRPPALMSEIRGERVSFRKEDIVA